MQPVAQTCHIQHQIVAQAAPELQAGAGHRLGLDQWQAVTLFAPQACNCLCIEYVALARSTQPSSALGCPARIDFVHPLSTNREELGYSASK